MDKRIAIPAGLAIMVALAVVGMLSIFSFTATQPAEASISEISQGIGNNAGLAKFVEPLKTPLTIGMTASATAVPVVAILPDDPGAPSSYTFTFKIQDGALANGVGKVRILFDNDDWTPGFHHDLLPGRGSDRDGRHLADAEGKSALPVRFLLRTVLHVLTF